MPILFSTQLSMAKKFITWRLQIFADDQGNDVTQDQVLKAAGVMSK